MKKLMMIMMGLVILSGCGSNSDVKKIGVAQIVEHSSLNIIRDSFLQEMEVLGYDKSNIEFDLKNANGDGNTMNSIMQKFSGDGKDCVVAIATPSAQVASKYSKDMPVIFSAVSDPVGAGLMSDLNSPDKNITGTSDEIQVDQILNLARSLQPNLKKIGVLYSSGEANSSTYVTTLKKLCEANGIAVEEVSITAVSDLQTAAQTLASKVDAIFTPNDNTIASAMPIFVKAAKDAKIPTYVGADSMVIDGGFASVGIDYEELGKETAKMVDEVLKGKDIRELPVKVFKEDLNVYINKAVLSELGLTLPSDVQNNPHLKMIGE